MLRASALVFEFSRLIANNTKVLPRRTVLQLVGRPGGMHKDRTDEHAQDAKVPQKQAESLYH